MKKIAILIAVLILFNCLSVFSTDEAEKVSVIITVNGDFDAGAFSETFGCEIIYTYEVCLNGFAAEINRADIYKIKSFKGVEGVFSEPYYNIPEPVEEEETEGGRRFRMMSAEETSFPGEGTAVAVIDSGCNVSNTAFGLPADTAGVKYSESDIADILSRNSLNAETSLPSLTANSAYKNAKFPFAFDYAGKGTDVYNASVPHGNSVAGIIGAKGSGVDGGADYTGVLPECQLIIMKVVSSSGAIKGSDVLAALEDSVVLGVDGINISLGATAGFSTHEADEYDLSGAIASARAQGIFVSVAAGNDGLLGRN